MDARKRTRGLVRRAAARPIALLFLSALLVLCHSCVGTRPAPLAAVQGLEACSNEADQKALRLAQRDLAAGRHEEAFERLLELVPRNLGCARLLVLLRRSLSFLSSGTQETRRKEAYELLREEERRLRVAGHRDANLAFGIALFEKDPKAEADWIGRALLRGPSHYYALAKSGELEWRKGNLNKAREQLARAVSLQKELAEAWLILAAVEEDSGNASGAARHYRSYLGLRPFDRQVAMRYLHLLIHDLREPKSARRLVEDLYEKSPGDLELGLDLAAIAWLEKKFSEAETRYKELLRRHPGEIRVLLNLANLYYATSKGKPLRKTKALQSYRYLVSLPVEPEPSSFGSQLLFAHARIKELLTELGDKAPPPPKSLEEIL